MIPNFLIPENFWGEEKGFFLENFIEISKRKKKTVNMGKGGGVKKSDKPADVFYGWLQRGEGKIDMKKYVKP